MVSSVLRHPDRKIIILFLASIIGKIVSTFPCSEMAPLHYRILDRFKIKCLREQNWKWNAKIILSSPCLQELDWWQKHVLIDKMKRSLHTPKITACTFSDSSCHSFGGTFLHYTISSKISEEQAKLSINNKELLAIYYTLSAFGQHLKNESVLHSSDSRSSVFTVNNKGSNDPFRDKITKKIYEVAN